ncbi:MAG: excinuclease ABC subunit UvrC [Acidobacteriota bacterium]
MDRVDLAARGEVVVIEVSEVAGATILEAKLERLPDGPGVYLFRDAQGKILYIGKAKNLKNRVRSYFQAGRTEGLKADYIRTRAADLDYIVTDNEVEALILESQLVKRHQPLLNVRLKDDKSFLHIKLTTNEPYPRVLLTRRIRDDGARYFGPYLPASLARNLIKIINRHFQLRTCSIPIDGKLERPCLEYHIHRCLGPCVDGLCTPEEYRRAVEEVILLLEGHNQELLRHLEAKMKEAAAREQFEAAAFFRDRIRMVQDLAEKQKMASTTAENVDVFGYYREGPRLTLQLFTLRDGKVVGKREFFWEDLEIFDPPTFLRDAVQQYYLSARQVPDTILLPSPIEDQDIIEEWLSSRRQTRRKVRILVPKRGTRLDLLMLVERNARIAFDSRFKILRSEKRKLLEDLQQVLALPQLPRRIEAFDISNIQGAETVASMVVCLDGVMARKEYRKFKIQSVTGPNDVLAMQEVVTRRYRRVLAEDTELPDLVLIDGGKPQLNAALQALAQLGIDDVPVCSLAKQQEEIFLPHRSDPVRLDLTSPALHLLQEIRDEAHRFAVTYHRKRRSLRDFASALDEIPGIGPKRRKRLLQHFGSIEGIRRARREELVPLVGARLADLIKKRLEQPSAPGSASGGTPTIGNDEDRDRG